MGAGVAHVIPGVVFAVLPASTVPKELIETPQPLKEAAAAIKKNVALESERIRVGSWLHWPFLGPQKKLETNLTIMITCRVIKLAKGPVTMTYY